MAQLKDLLVAGKSRFVGEASFSNNLNVAGVISGNGENITNLNASNIESGTLDSERLPSSGVSATSYGPSASTAPAHGGQFSVPYFTVDQYGRITSAKTQTITLPGSGDTDTKVTQTVTSSNASYPLLLAPSGQTATTITTSYFDSGITLNPSTNFISGAKLEYIQNTAPTQPDAVIKIGSNNFDVNIFKVYDRDSGFNANGGYGYSLMYNGTGTGVNNSLTLYCDNTSSDPCIGWQLNQQGYLGLGQAANTTHRLAVKGHSAIDGCLTMRTGHYYGEVNFAPSMSTNTMGHVLYYTGTSAEDTTFTKGHFTFREYSYTADSKTKLSYYEQYILPDVNTGRKGNATYNILTSKNTVTVAQGGTGATSLTAKRMAYTKTNDDGDTVLTAGYHYVDNTHVAVGSTSVPNYALYVGTSNDAAGTLGVAKSITIANTSDAIGHFNFSRASYNYITAPTGGSIAFDVSGTGGGSSAPCDLVVTNGEVIPGATKETNLGSSSKQWNNIYANNIILSSTTNSSQTAASTPALRIGSSDSAIHLIVDRDAINAKATSTTAGTLNINESGGLVKIGPGGMTTSGDVTISATGRGYRLTDSSGYTYSGICDNGTNLWVGASATKAKHHIGQTYISSGYDSTNSVGNESIYVSVPNDSNSNALNHMILHTGIPNRINLYGAQAYTNGSANYIYKIATCSGTLNSSTNFDASLTLLATGFYGDSSYKNGILKAEVRWDKGKTAPAKAILRWISADGNIAPENYILTYKLNNSIVTLNIYASFGSATWESMNFTKLTEHTWGNSKNRYDWTLYQVSGTNGITAIPSDETKVPSTLGTINMSTVKANTITATTSITAPTFSGNATSASKVYATKSITNSTQYFPMYTSGNASGNKDAYIHPRFYIWDTGSRLHLCVGEQGTSTSDNTGAYSGGLTLNSGSGKGKYVDIIPAAMTSHRTITIPDASGTICLTSHNHDDTYLKLSGGTMTGPIKSASSATSWVDACKEKSIINSTKSVPTSGKIFSPMLSSATANGRMALAFYTDALQVGYITKADCDAGTNTLTSSAVLFNESGGASWSGSVSVGEKLTLGGDLYYSNINGTTNYADKPVMQFKPGNSDGCGVIIGGGALTVVGGGESAANFIDSTKNTTSSLPTVTTEALYLTSDGSIFFATGCQSNYNTLVGLNAARSFYPSETGTGSLGTSTYRWGNSYVKDLDASGTANAKEIQIDSSVKFVYNSNDKCIDIIFN